MDLDHVAGELYALPRAEFTAARTAKVAEARRTGNRQLAATINELRRPTTSAAVVNVLVRRRPELIDDLLALADDLRRAQSALAGDDLRRLSARRNEVVSALVDEGHRVAADQQHPLTAAGEGELTATFQAALADPDAAEAVRSGRLTSALQYSGFGLGSADLDTTPSARRTERPVRPRRAEPLRVVAQVDPEEVAAATAAVTAAQSRLDEVQQAAAHADEAVIDTQRRRQEAAGRITELERQLTQARDDERQAARELRAQEKERDRAARMLQAARHRLERAQEALNRRKRP